MDHQEFKKLQWELDMARHNSPYDTIKHLLLIQEIANEIIERLKEAPCIACGNVVHVSANREWLAECNQCSSGKEYILIDGQLLLKR